MIIETVMKKAVKTILEKTKRTMFVTVGNGTFDPLVKEIDRLKQEGKIRENVIIQIGNGTYQPKNCKWFTFAPELHKYYQQADLIISHGGPGTVFEILRMGKKLIAVPNRDRTDPQHQVEYLQAMAKETSAFLYCDDVSQLSSTLEKAKTHRFEKYDPPSCTMAEEVIAFLEKDRI